MASATVAIAAAALLAWACLFLLGVRTRRALVLLDAAPGPRRTPSLTVVVPCRDEARGVEAAVDSLLSQDLPELQVIAVDDRSTDATGAILDRLAGEDPRLLVLHVTALPPGWLGKNHACAEGARRAAGEWLLFTDGDVVFGPGVLRRALAAAERLGLGHLTLVPRFLAPGFAERAFVTGFASLLSPAARIWELPRARSRAFFGVGAFNLVRRDAYERAGGHRRIALEVVDDVKLGLLLRRTGVPQGVADSRGLVAVRWQHGFVPSVLGLVKNAFAAVEYRLWVALLGAAGGAFLGAAPVALLVLPGPPATRALAGAALALSLAHHAAFARRLSGGSGAEALLAPACTVILAGVLLASALAARARRGVVWRGTRYALDEVRAGCLRDADLPASGAVGWPPPAVPASAPEASRPPPPRRVRW